MKSAFHLYKYREPIALIVCGTLAALLFGDVLPQAQLVPKYDDPIAIEIVDFMEVPELPKPVVTATPKSFPEIATTVPMVIPQPQKNIPTQTPSQAIETSSATHSVSTSESSSENKPSSALQAPISSQADSIKSVDQSRHKNVDAEFVAQLRAYLNTIKRYPTGREASTQRPKGVVRVWFVLKRDGGLVDAGVEASSNSTLLDDAARKTVNRAQFPSFPDGFKPNETTYRFTAEIEFIPVG